MLLSNVYSFYPFFIHVFGKGTPYLFITLVGEMDSPLLIFKMTGRTGFIGIIYSTSKEKADYIELTLDVTSPC